MPEQQTQERIVGIDLGTTNSLVAYMEGSEPVVIPGVDGSNLVPSIVALDIVEPDSEAGTRATVTVGNNAGPITITARSSSRANPPTMARSSAYIRSPCSSWKSQKID